MNLVGTVYSLPIVTELLRHQKKKIKLVFNKYVIMLYADVPVFYSGTLKQVRINLASYRVQLGGPSDI